MNKWAFTLAIVSLEIKKYSLIGYFIHINHSEGHASKILLYVLFLSLREGQNRMLELDTSRPSNQLRFPSHK